MDMYQINLSSELIKQESMTGALELGGTKKKVISFVGAGGKTTAIHHLAKELVSVGKRVVITTTTHMFLPEKYGVLQENKEKILKMLNAYGIAVSGIPCGDGKITKVSDFFFGWMKTIADYILVEADGSKRLPIKVPDEHEPVLPLDTDLVVIVAGLTCLYRPLMECCHRWMRADDILNCHPKHKITPTDVAKLIQVGYCNSLNKPFKILLNQCDNEELRKEAVKIIGYMGEYESALISSMLCMDHFSSNS